MRSLDWKQTRAVLSALDLLYSDVEPDTLPRRLLGAARAAVASETVLVDGFGAANEMRSLAQYPAGLMTPGDYAALAHLLPTHPLFKKVVLTRQTAPFRIKDIVSPTEFRKTALYHEMFRPMAISDQLIMGVRGLRGDSFVTCCLNRDGRGFTQSDRQAMRLVGPHLAAAVKGAQSLQRARESEARLRVALNTPARALVVVAPSSRITYATESAAPLAQKYFGRGALCGDRLPPEVESWRREFEDARGGGDYHPPAGARVRAGADGELRVTFAPNGATGELMLLLEEKSYPTPERLRALGLTKREAEVLFWVAQGKTDWEAAALCGISPRTVQIHLARVYAKLGVENRTAATLKMFELLQS
ncbi:MAG TPA: helix-turn-helix transcriptional regulator [Pyrinomonadaceae bacterium]|nr:helix-turn-helix transcriptional regulator [Pyrinomonadaceae bacterium]